LGSHFKKGMQDMDDWQNKGLSEADVVRLKAAALTRPPWRALVDLMVELGLRTGEVFGLRAGDVDLVERRLSVVDRRVGRFRVVPLPGDLVEGLRRLVEFLDEEDLVFGWSWYSPQVRREWRQLTRAAGVDGARMHDLRRTCVVRKTAALREVLGIDPRYWAVL
jgi:integrase